MQATGEPVVLETTYLLRANAGPDSTWTAFTFQLPETGIDHLLAWDSEQNSTVLPLALVPGPGVGGLTEHALAAFAINQETRLVGWQASAQGTFMRDLTGEVETADAYTPLAPGYWVLPAEFLEPGTRLGIVMAGQALKDSSIPLYVEFLGAAWAPYVKAPSNLSDLTRGIEPVRLSPWSKGTGFQFSLYEEVHIYAELIYIHSFDQQGQVAVDYDSPFDRNQTAPDYRKFTMRAEFNSPGLTYQRLYLFHGGEGIGLYEGSIQTHRDEHRLEGAMADGTFSVTIDGQDRGPNSVLYKSILRPPYVEWIDDGPNAVMTEISLEHAGASIVTGYYIASLSFNLQAEEALGAPLATSFDRWPVQP